MNSLQKPRKITIYGNEGSSHVFLCKPKDDLRKDCRLMEFNSMINRLLKKDPISRRKKLRKLLFLFKSKVLEPMRLFH